MNALLENPGQLLLPAVMVLLLVVMFRNGRKRQRAAVEMRNSVVPGVEVLLQGGIFGTVAEVHDDDQRIVLEISPGAHMTVHRQAVVSVVPKAEPDEAEQPDTDRDTPSNP